MASYLPTSYLPQSIQKRLLRAALSSLGIFDTPSLDLDNLDLEFGLRSTLSLRNLGLDVEACLPTLDSSVGRQLIV
jgi:hypothetical protein